MDEFKGLVQCSFAKDLNFRFTSTTDVLAEMAGCDSSSDMLSRDDYQLAWRRDADYFRKSDIEIVKGLKCYSQLESIQVKKPDDSNALKETKIIITKAPLIDTHGNCIGLCGSLIDVTDLTILPKIGAFDEHKRLWLTAPFCNEYLTDVEYQVLKEIMFTGERGVARNLGLARSTVSTHIQRIRRKLQCKTVVELRRLVILSGLVHELFSKDIMVRHIKEKAIKESVALKKPPVHI